MSAFAAKRKARKIQVADDDGEVAAPVAVEEEASNGEFLPLRQCLTSLADGWKKEANLHVQAPRSVLLL